MVQSIRLTEAEQHQLREKAIEINKILVFRDEQPLKDSEIVHKILELSMDCLSVADDGELFLRRR